MAAPEPKEHQWPGGAVTDAALLHLMAVAERSLLEIVGTEDLLEILTRAIALRMACEVILYHSQYRSIETIVAARRAWMVFESAIQIQESRAA